MEQQLAQLLAETQSAQETPRRQAELQLKQLYTNDRFPLGLTSLALLDSAPIGTRQSALLVLKKYVETSWSPNLDEFEGQVLVSDENKSKLRHALFDIATGDDQERKIKSAASLVLSKVASADFPDEWPDLLPNLLQMIPQATDGQLHGALKVLQDLVDDSLNEEQFFKVAHDLVRTIYEVAVNESRRPTLRALAISVFRSSFDTLEMVMEDHKAAVTSFAEQTLNGWSPFFLTTIKSPLPTTPADGESTDASEHYRGLVALKLQVVKVLMRIRSVFPSVLAPQSLVLFSAVWEELSTLQTSYRAMYIDDERQGRLEDADGLPYTLDFLVLEELDFMQACLRAPPVRKELQKQLQSPDTATWVIEVMKLAVNYAHITTEEEGLWDIDVNIFLSEESSVTANYTPRTACGDLAVKLGEWIQDATVNGLLAQSRTIFSGESDWKAKEAALYVLNALLRDIQEVDRTISAEAAHGYVDFVNNAMQQEEAFLRARGHLVAGSLIKTSGSALSSIGPQFMSNSLSAMSSDPSDVVKVSCVRALQSYLSSLEPSQTHPLQTTIIASLSQFLATQDLNDLSESEDVMIALLETLRDAILLDTRVVLSDNASGIDLLFTLASHGASNFQLAMLITETFEEVASTLSSTSPDVFSALCGKVLPSLTGAFDLANLTEENALTNLAAEMLSVLTENASSPLPQGYVATVMPKLQRMLLASTDDELLKSATTVVKEMLAHDSEQVFAWRDEEGKEGLEVLLVIIDRLLSPAIDDNAGSEVGGLAAALVEKAGGERLGPYLGQLLKAVAVRLATAERAGIIQSLILVFARLSVDNVREVVDFLSQTEVEGRSGLEVVVSKWVENSVNFAGYEDIRVNVIALTRLYDLQPSPLPSLTVKGDLVVTQSSRIITRSRAKQNPTQYTLIPADQKILKILVEELLPASGPEPKSAISAAAGGSPEDDDEDDEEWEDDPHDFLDLGSGMTKEQLMAFGEGRGTEARGRGDDETQRYLVEWFRGLAQRPGADQVWSRLSDGEKERISGWLG
ncbi:importin beta N terminal domain-containing protein [Elsinoe australis]|uniref:Importin beta N terminal domain-containing protein n=1 Tax=Elsinoe australis TaxID=40998 RepID=A0A4U7AT75_9PEZI|nr:importin beta N terminal domain-containing protein [Elsinoe australis]